MSEEEKTIEQKLLEQARLDMRLNSLKREERQKIANQNEINEYNGYVLDICRTIGLITAQIKVKVPKDYQLIKVVGTPSDRICWPLSSRLQAKANEYLSNGCIYITPDGDIIISPTFFEDSRSDCRSNSPIVVNKFLTITQLEDRQKGWSGQCMSSKSVRDIGLKLNKFLIKIRG